MNKDIVTRIQAIIDHFELSVSGFADEIGVQRSSISHLLNGRNKPSLDFVMKLVNTYPEVDLYWLLKGEGYFPRKADTEILNETDGTSEEVEMSIDENLEISHSNNEKQINGPVEPYKIVFFYTDGTFKTFSPKND
ncbi:helix-turn-helix transcriptional regulator [Allomuricauda sp. F6463D]|uniref:helix-turn-helix transcriptional regulator n=1 Tax=Allomuricauda sp. F6463D TaxID=2926409 RepID=UPI001FF22540|nr:helix-turn-helix transcriptional regulator [Muricauda sp. F6463D]MCK0159504.1 helix-turn-helix domain-containing protein [Muricauda sp. F6463D]